MLVVDGATYLEEYGDDGDDDEEGVCIFQRPTVIAKEQQQKIYVL